MACSWDHLHLCDFGGYIASLSHLDLAKWGMDIGSITPTVPTLHWLNYHERQWSIAKFSQGIMYLRWCLSRDTDSRCIERRWMIAATRFHWLKVELLYSSESWCLEFENSNLKSTKPFAILWSIPTSPRNDKHNFAEPRQPHLTLHGQETPQPRHSWSSKSPVSSTTVAWSPLSAATSPWWNGETPYPTGWNEGSKKRVG